MRKFRLLMGPFLEHVATTLGFGVIFPILSLFFLEVLTVSHFDSRLTLGLRDTIVQNQSMLILNMELLKFLTDKCFNLLEYFHIILGD